MSSAYYNNKWKEAINDLLENIHEEFEPLDENLNQKGLKYERSDQEWFSFYSHLYIKYVQCYKILQDCYDQLVHPQKRMLLKEMLESTMLRVVQIKLNLIRYNTNTNSVRSQYVNLDEFLLEMRLRPAEIEMHIPRYFVYDKVPDKQKRNQIIQKFLIDLKQTSLPQQQVIQEKSALDTNMETAIRIIQKIQRGRQGIVRALKAVYFQKRQKRRQARKRQNQGNENFDFDDAQVQQKQQVTMIQKTIKGFLARRQVDKIRQKQLIFLGIIKKPQNPNDPKTAAYKMNKNRQKMRQIQLQNDKQYQQTIGSLKDQLYEKWEQPMKQKMLRDRRLWISQFMERNQFSKIPDTVKDFYQKDKVKIPPTAQQLQMMQKLAEAKKKQKGKGKKKKKLTQKDKFQKDNPRAGPTETVLIMQQQIQKHTKQWKDQISPEDKPQMRKIKQTVLPEVQDQIQKMVDDMIELELANLRIKFKKKKGKKKKKKKKKKKQKKIKVPGWKEIKKIPPLDQIGHLVDFGVLKKLVPARIKDLIGEPNFLRTKEEMSSQLMPDPSYFDVRQILVELVGIPLGSQFVKTRLDKLHYFLFFGPHGAGKTLMIRALAHQTDSIVLELSPYTLEAKINDKKQLNKMLAMTFNVAKTFPPAIIYMDEVQQIFKGKKKKKKGAGGAAGPNFTKLRKTLTKYKKKVLKKQDRVAVIACTNKPWEMNKKFVKPFAQKKFYFPFPNYATRKALFEHFMQKKGVKLPDSFPVTTIAHVTQGYTGGNFKEAIDKVVTQRRLLQINQKMSARQLQVNEFIGPLANQSSTYIEQYQKFRQFNDEVTGIKQRRQKKNAPAQGDQPAKKKK